MSVFLDTTGRPTYGIGLCARCSRKFPLGELFEDPNFPALYVCRDDLDQYDPYRLAPRPEDQIVLPFVRPDLPIATHPSGLIGENGDFFIITENNEYYLDLAGLGAGPDRPRSNFLLLTTASLDGLKLDDITGDLLLINTLVS